MNGITFTGIKNIGACGFSRKIPNSEHAIVKNNLILQLTDDYNGRDLTSFEEVIKNCNAKKWFRNFPEDNRIIHIMTEYQTDLSKEVESIYPSLYLNYNPVPVNKETLPLFSYIAKLTRRIFNMKDSEFKRDSDFVYGPIGRICLIPEYDMLAIAKNLKYKFRNFMNEVPFSNQSSRQFAEKINENINKQMIDYLR
ncbi:hypothetical protein IKQ21_06325 [bacterium]|nr:hypothetical protein [bacterium]